MTTHYPRPWQTAIIAAGAVMTQRAIERRSRPRPQLARPSAGWVSTGTQEMHVEQVATRIRALQDTSPAGKHAEMFARSDLHEISLAARPDWVRLFFVLPGDDTDEASTPDAVWIWDWNPAGPALEASLCTALQTYLLTDPDGQDRRWLVSL
jgi:hypothetical protein